MAVRLGLRAVRRFGGGRHFPFVFVWYAARGILTPGGGVPAGLARYGWYALAAALLSAAIYFAGLMCTHLAAFRVATNMRKAAVAHLIDLPLGYFNANLTGRLRKQIDDNAALTETLLAHTIPDAVGGIVTPILAVGLLFVFDWRMGLACLIPMIIGLICLMTMMTGTGMKFFEEYQRAGERISAEATEYVRGIPVVKMFQQTVYSFNAFYAAIQDYSDLASQYAMSCRTGQTCFLTFINGGLRPADPGGAAHRLRRGCAGRAGEPDLLRPVRPCLRPDDQPHHVYERGGDGGRRGHWPPGRDPEPAAHGGTEGPKEFCQRRRGL